MVCPVQSRFHFDCETEQSGVVRSDQQSLHNWLRHIWKVQSFSKKVFQHESKYFMKIMFLIYIYFHCKYSWKFTKYSANILELSLVKCHSSCMIPGLFISQVIPFVKCLAHLRMLNNPECVVSCVAVCQHCVIIRDPWYTSLHRAT